MLSLLVRADHTWRVTALCHAPRHQYSGKRVFNGKHTLSRLRVNCPCLSSPNPNTHLSFLYCSSQRFVKPMTGLHKVPMPTGPASIPTPLFPQLLQIGSVAGLSHPYLKSVREWGDRAAVGCTSQAGAGAGQQKPRGKGLCVCFSGENGLARPLREDNLGAR